MEKQARNIKVWVCLIASMTAGAFVLMSLENNALNAGAFSLSSYVKLKSVEKVAQPLSTNQNWQKVEVSYTTDPKINADAHFLICDETSGLDGQIVTTKTWQNPNASAKKQDTIKVCVVTDSINATPTDIQIQRAAALVNELSKICSIANSKINYPANWQL